MKPRPLFELDAHLLRRIRGQEHAIRPIAEALMRTHLGVQKRCRILALGPTGTGKTETALAFSDYLDDGDGLERFDCSEYQSPGDTTRQLLGNRSGDRGRFGDLAARSQTRTLLFDEIEKAERGFLNLLLQILEPGRITLACGEVIDLSRYHIYCTSNVASNEILELQQSSNTTLERHVLRQAREWLRPEIFNRFDETLVFRPLEFDTQLEIVGQMLAAYLQRLPGEGGQVTADPGVGAFLLRHRFDRDLGGRPLWRAIEKFVGNVVLQDRRNGGTGCGHVVVHPQEPILMFERPLIAEPGDGPPGESR